jgi:long-chain acyl-CoA synthetase
MTARNQGDRIVSDRPDQVAIVSTVDGRSVTYRELEQLVTSTAAFVASRTTPGDSVGILAENGIAWVVIFFAIQRAGAVPVPISHRLPAPGV